MACNDCEQKQDGDTSAFYRWKAANIEMRGCDVHLREIFDVLNEIQSRVIKQAAP